VKVGIVYDPVYLKHDTGEHVENAGRLTGIISNLEQCGLMSQLISLAPRPATPQELALVHYPQHINNIQSLARKGGCWIDSDTFVSGGSYEAAIYAAGGTIRAAEAVMDGKVDSAFALVRPPGHHATPGQAMGFCLFNNIAITARYALSRYSLERLAIIDFDVHHGNGTQAAFETDPGVLYVSVHQHPLYPGTGNLDDTGSGAAAGTKVNVPLPPDCGDAAYGTVFERIVAPAVRRFQPQLILVSAGYDSHWSDNLSAMEVSLDGFVRIITIIKSLAAETCHNRLCLVLEGGYSLKTLPAAIKATLDVLMDNPQTNTLESVPGGIRPPDITHLVQRILEVHDLV
jgi:acetoin utilization deacetylase AcuC-like enzyme